MSLKSRDPQKAHLGTLLNVHTYFQLLPSIWRGVMRGIHYKIKKKRQKPTFQGLSGGDMGLKRRYPQKAHLGPLLNIPT